MKQRFYHYTEWEDFQHGMYEESKDGREERVQAAVDLLSDTSLLYKQMTRVVHEWKKATEQNMTNSSINYRAFLGQAACSIYADVHEDETREAWGRLTNDQRYQANAVATRVYKEWKHDYLIMTEPFYQLFITDLEDV